MERKNAFYKYDLVITKQPEPTNNFNGVGVIVQIHNDSVDVIHPDIATQALIMGRTVNKKHLTRLSLDIIKLLDFKTDTISINDKRSIDTYLITRTDLYSAKFIPEFDRIDTSCEGKQIIYKDLYGRKFQGKVINKIIRGKDQKDFYLVKDQDGILTYIPATESIPVSET